MEATLATERQSQVTEQFNKLRNSSEILTDLIIALEDRLKTVLRAEVPVENLSDKVDPALVTVAEDLYTINERTQNNINILRDYLSRLEL